MPASSPARLVVVAVTLGARAAERGIIELERPDAAIAPARLARVVAVTIVLIVRRLGRGFVRSSLPSGHGAETSTTAGSTRAMASARTSSSARADETDARRRVPTRRGDLNSTVQCLTGRDSTCTPFFEKLPVWYES